MSGPQSAVQLEMRDSPHLQHYGLFYAVTALLVGVVLFGARFLYLELVLLQIDPLERRQVVLLENAASAINYELGGIHRLIRLLKNDPSIQASLRWDHPWDTAPMVEHFAHFAKLTPLVSQIRWLDGDGQERVRIDAQGGEIREVPAAELQDKSGRYYFRDVVGRHSSLVYFSPIDLNIEHGQIVRPLEPTLRVAMATGGVDELRPGVLVINVRLKPLIARLRQLSDDDVQLLLANDAGTWMLHRDPAREWGDLLGNPDNNLERHLPALWNRVKGDDQRLGFALHGDLWSFSHIAIGGGGTRALTAIVATGGRRLVAIRTRALLEVMAFGLITLLPCCLLVWRLSEARWRERSLGGRLALEKVQLERAYRDLASAHAQSEALQEELVEASKLSALGLTVAGVAHEINTPAGSALMTLSSLAESRLRLQQQFEQGMTRGDLEQFLGRSAECIALMERGLGRVVELVRSFKRLALDRVDESVICFDLGERLSDLQNSMHPRFKDSRVRLAFQVAPGLTLCSYPGILSQVLENLVENALTHGHAGGRGGSVRVEARADEAAGGVVISVADDGRGIDPAIRDRLFEPFVTTGRGRGCTGLGMHLVHQWVTQVLKGRLTVESQPGEGSTFTLRLPDLEPEADAAAG